MVVAGILVFFFYSRRRHTRCALGTVVQACALPICLPGSSAWRRGETHPAAKWISRASNAAVLADERDRRRLQGLGARCFQGCDAYTEALARELGPERRSLLTLVTNSDPARVPALVAALPEAVRQQMARLSLSRRNLSPLTGRLILVHGRRDPLVPYSVSMALAGAVPGSELFLIDRKSTRLNSRH